MRAIVCEKLGDPEHLVLRDVASPSPGPGEVKVALRARGVSFVDVLVIAGQYQTKREVPFIPGGEAAGVVVEVGAGVQHVAPGDRVLAPGGYADEAVMLNQRYDTPEKLSGTDAEVIQWRRLVVTKHFGGRDASFEYRNPDGLAPDQIPLSRLSVRYLQEQMRTKAGERPPASR